MSALSNALTRSVAALACVLAVAGCGSSGRPVAAAFEAEAFESTDTHTRMFGATQAQTCEAARRALLSQGYLLTAAQADLVAGRKSFQPSSEVHVEVELRVVCAPGNSGGAGGGSVAFASALQDRYSLKKVNNSASVGVPALGSLSVPFSSSDDALVKVASATLTDERFYDRFFALLERFLVPGAEATPVPPPALPAPRDEAPLRSVPPSPTRG